MGTFGVEGKGGTFTGINDRIACLKATCPEVGTAYSIKVWLETNQLRLVRCALYAYVGDGNAGALLGITEERDVNVAPAAVEEFVFNNPKPALANTTYFLAAYGEDATCGTFRDAGGTGHCYLDRAYDSTYPDPLAGESSSTFTRSIYCEYTTSQGVPAKFGHYAKMRT